MCGNGRGSVGHYLQLYDLFVVGLGLDLAGAYLVARGVVASPATLMRLVGFIGSYQYTAAGRARDRLDALAGLVSLALGFALQGVGYVVLLATEIDVRTGAEEAAGAVALALAAIAVAIAAAAVFRRKRLKPTLREMAQRDIDGTRLAYPRGDMLAGWADGLGEPVLPGENELDYARRAYGVDDILLPVVGGGFERGSVRYP